MKYKLETIPVIDAIEKDTECPFCLLYNKAQNLAIKFYTGASVMNPETRVQANKTGFCPTHGNTLLKAQQVQNVGLLYHTYLQDYLKDQKKVVKQLEKLSGEKKGKVAAAVKEWEKFIRNKTLSCLICDRLGYTMKRYYFTLVYNFIKDAEFKELVKQSKGFCHPHLLQLLEMVQEILPERKYHLIIEDLLELQMKSYQRLEEEVLWFTQKFKSENADKSWGTSKDAHIRTVHKLAGDDEHIS